jgi:hypothetical protein
LCGLSGKSLSDFGEVASFDFFAFFRGFRWTPAKISSTLGKSESSRHGDTARLATIRHGPLTVPVVHTGSLQDGKPFRNFELNDVFNTGKSLLVW